MIEIQERINSMSLEELKQQLAAYMAADPHFAPRPMAVEVRLSNDSHARCRYDVLLITENGEETEVKFSDRYSRLIYIYTLLHPKGYQRRLAAANDYRVLRNLYYALYVKDNEALIKTIESTGFDHFCNHYIASFNYSRFRLEKSGKVKIKHLYAAMKASPKYVFRKFWRAVTNGKENNVE